MNERRVNSVLPGSRYFNNFKNSVVRDTLRVLGVALALSAAVLVPVLEGSQPAAGATNAGGVLNFGDQLTGASAVLSVDPAHTSGSPLEAEFNNLIYSDLLNLGPSGSGTLLPGLASSWSVPNAQTITLNLRPNVQFQDGTPLNAEAVVFNLKRDLGTPNPYINTTFQQALSNGSIVASGKYSVTLHLTQPVAGALLPAFGQNVGWIASPTAVVKEGSSYQQHPVGAGPYKLTAYTPGQLVSVRKWSGYWQGSSCAPYGRAHNCWRLGGVNFINTTSGAPAVASLRAGQVDYIRITDAAADSEVQGQSDISTITQPTSTGLIYFRTCSNSAPLNNPLVRKAISLAINRATINQVVSNGQATPTSEMWTPASPYYSKAYAVTYNPKKATQLIRKAGAVGASFPIMYESVPNFKDAASVLQAQLRAIGLNVTLSGTPNVEQDLLIDKKSPAGELAVVSPGGAPKVQTMVPGQLANWCDYSNPVITHAYTVLEAGTASQAQLKALWTQVNEIVYQDSMIFPLYNATATGAYNNSRVRGVKMLLDNGGQGIPIFQTMYVRSG